MNGKVLNVLFVSSDVAGAGLMAESILGHVGGEHFAARSATVAPVEHAHPMTIDELWNRGYPTLDLGLKPAAAYARPDAPPLDIVVTVGKQDAEGPRWPGNPLTVSWDIATPEAGASDEQLRSGIQRTCEQIEGAVKRLAAMPVERLERSLAAARLRSLT